MYKYLLFSEPQSLVFYSSATALAQYSSFYFAITKVKHLIFRSKEKNANKASIPLTKHLQLSKSETVPLMQILSLETSSPSKTPFLAKSNSNSSGNARTPHQENNGDYSNVSLETDGNQRQTERKGQTCSLLLGTSKLNFFILLIDLQTQKILQIQKVNFGYKATLKRLSSNSKFISPKKGLTLLVSANFVFYMTNNEPRLKLLKILREKALSVEVDFLNKDQLYILGKKQLIFGSMENLPGSALSFKETLRLPNKRKFIGMKPMRKKLIFFNKHKQIRVFELDRQDFTYKIEINQSFKESLNFSNIYVIDGDIIAVHDEKYLYSLSLKMNRIWQIVNLNDSHFAVLPDGQILTLQPKSENLFSVAQIKIKKYQKANKINKFLSLSKFEKLKIIFAYLTRKFLKLFKFQDYNKVIYNLLLKMNLSNGIIKQPEFKAEVLKFYNLITDFSLKTQRSAVKGSKNWGINSQTSLSQDSGSALRSNQSVSSTSASPQKSPRKKNLNYMVVKPFVDIRLPRKNAPKLNQSDEIILKSIMVKGQKHYNKFLRFKEFDEYPKDCIDSIYARFQSRINRIKSGKRYLKNIVRYFTKDPMEKAEHLFFFAYKFEMKNNYKLLHSIFMGFDLCLWVSPVQRKIYYQVMLKGIENKNNSFRLEFYNEHIQKITNHH